MYKNVVLKFLFLIGSFLFILNTIGFFIPLRSAQVDSRKSVYSPSDNALKYKDAKKEVVKKKSETDEQYVLKATDAIYKSVMHYWDEEIDEFRLRIPIWENFVLFLMSYTQPQEFLKYEFCDHKKALQRGVGLCSQAAIIEVGYLNKNGIEANIIGLGGHTVTRCKVDKDKSIWYVADPDYGVVLPFDIDKIESDPTIIKQFYEKKGYNSTIINDLIKIYDKDHNYTRNSIKEYKSKSIYNDKNSYIIEQVAYFLKWAIPTMLMLPFSVFLLFIYHRKYNKRFV